MAQKAYPIPVHDRENVFSEPLQVGNRIDVCGTWLTSESVVEVCTQRRMPDVSGKLADVVDMVGDGKLPRDTACVGTNRITRTVRFRISMSQAIVFMSLASPAGMYQMTQIQSACLSLTALQSLLMAGNIYDR